MPVGFFVEGAKDKEKKIADLRSEHDTRSSTQGFQIPRVDWEGYQKDPIGASLDTFQSVLQGVINKDTARRKEQRAEGLQVASDLYKAAEAAGIETNEAELADKFYEQTGVSIYSVTRQHGRYTGQANGRIAGRNAASEMSKRIDSMEFKTPAEFDTAWEKEMAKYDKEAFNDSNKQGYLEIMGKSRLAMTEKVFKGSLLLKEQEARAVFGKEIQGTFREAVTAEDQVAGWGTYQATILANDAEMRKSNPSLQQDELESVYIASIDAELNDGLHLDRVDDAVDNILASGVVKTQKGRAALLEKKGRALKMHESASSDPSPEVKARLHQMTPEMQAEYLEHGEWSEKSVSAYLDAGGNSHYAAAQLDALRGNMEGIAKGTKDAEGTLSDDVKMDFYEARKNNDIAGMGAVLSTEVMRSAIGDATAEAWVNSSLDDYKAAKKGKLTVARDALNSYDEWATEYYAEKTPAERLVKYEELQLALSSLPGESVVEANKIKNAFQDSIIKADTEANAKVTEIQRIERDGAAFSWEAQTMMDEVDTRLIPQQLQLQKLIAAEQVRSDISDETPGVSVFGFGSEEQIRTKKNRDEVIQFREAAQRKILNIKAERIRWETERDELMRVEQATKGLTTPQRTSYQIWNGNPDGSDRNPYYS
jgi:hypothetical protein